MTTQKAVLAQPKWAGKSMSILGAIISVLVTGYQVAGPILDATGITVPVTTGDIQEAGNVIGNTITAIGGLAGFAMVVWGRIRAGKNVQPVTILPNQPSQLVHVEKTTSEIKPAESFRK